MKLEPSQIQFFLQRTTEEPKLKRSLPTEFSINQQTINQQNSGGSGSKMMLDRDEITINSPFNLGLNLADH
jgi:hypothetical protein